MDTTASLGGATEFTVSLFVRLDTMVASFGVGQWGTGYPNNAWISAPADSGTYGPGSDGFRNWFDTASFPTQGQWGNTLTAPVVLHHVARYNGAGATDADRLRVWGAAYESGTAIDSWGEKTLVYQGSPAIPSALANGGSLPNIMVGGAQYSTAQDINGLVGMVAIWDSALTPAQIAGLHDSATRQPTDPTALAPTWWWQPTAADIGASGLTDRGSGGANGTFASGNGVGDAGGAPTVVAWSE